MPPTVEEFYRGSTLRLISSAGPPSGYTIWARFIAQYLGRYIPGNPDHHRAEHVGGRRADRHQLHVRDRTAGRARDRLGGARGADQLSLMKADGVKYDLLKFNWLATPTSETNICIRVEGCRGAPTAEDLLTNQLIVGSDGVGSGMHIYPVALNALLGMKFKTIDGYADTGVVLLALDRGEVQGSCQSAETLLRARGDAIRAGQFRIVLQAGLKPSPTLPGVPFVFDLARNDDERQALRFLYAGLTFGRPYLAPPGVPPERVAALRKAFADTFADPDFQREAMAQGYELNPISGEEMMRIMQELANTPQPVIDQIAALMVQH